eukprot:8764673-Pyramimonas_sp.AAC.1
MARSSLRSAPDLPLLTCRCLHRGVRVSRPPPPRHPSPIPFSSLPFSLTKAPWRLRASLRRRIIRFTFSHASKVRPFARQPPPSRQDQT